MPLAQKACCFPRLLEAPNTSTITSNCSTTMSLKSRVDADSMLQLDNVSVGYPRHVVLAGVTLAIQRGTFTGLLGSNGSGKTTLLKTIVGIIPPLEGKLTWNPEVRIDRKSTRLNSSHLVISYAVFCLK